MSGEQILTEDYRACSMVQQGLHIQAYPQDQNLNIPCDAEADVSVKLRNVKLVDCEKLPRQEHGCSLYLGLQSRQACLVIHQLS
jgi:hypothetical protein